MSHLATILKRVRNPAGNSVPHLVSVIEYIRNFDDYSNEEYSEAIDVLRKRGSGLEPGSAEALMIRHFGPREFWKRACVRCGRLMNGTSEPARGMGKDCYEVVQDGAVVDSGRPFGPRRTPVKADPSRFLRIRFGGV